MKARIFTPPAAHGTRIRLSTIALAIQVLLSPFGYVRAAGTELPELTRPLSKVEALNLALAKNGTIREAQKEVEAAAGIAIQTRAILFPKLDVLNAQTALTEARGSYVDALRNYSVARATLIRATGADLQH